MENKLLAIVIVMNVLLLGASCRNNYSETSLRDKNGKVVSEGSQDIDIPTIQSPQITNKNSIPGELFLSDSKKIKYKISGSWSVNNTVKTERKMSWGIVKLGEPYLVLDLISAKPLLIHGYSEGGPSFDHTIGRIVGLSVNGDNITIYYKKIISWKPFQEKEGEGRYFYSENQDINIVQELSQKIFPLLLHYSEVSDMLSIDPQTGFGGTRYTENDSLYRLSPKISE